MPNNTYISIGYSFLKVLSNWEKIAIPMVIFSQLLTTLGKHNNINSFLIISNHMITKRKHLYTKIIFKKYLYIDYFRENS